jgi:hypothetical protein
MLAKEWHSVVAINLKNKGDIVLVISVQKVVVMYFPLSSSFARAF